MKGPPERRAFSRPGLCTANERILTSFRRTRIAATSYSGRGPEPRLHLGRTVHTVTVVVGPVIVPTLPVTVCLDLTCVPVPIATVVAVGLSLTESVTALPPTVTTLPCPAGETGTVEVINSGGAIVAVGGSIFAVVDGIVDVIPIGPVVLPVTHTIIVSACST